MKDPEIKSVADTIRSFIPLRYDLKDRNSDPGRSRAAGKRAIGRSREGGAFNRLAAAGCGQGAAAWSGGGAKGL
jgi:hypothetical protein